MYKIKIELTMEELIFLRVTLNTIDTNDKELAEKLYAKLVNAKPHFVSVRKQRATERATEVRSDRAREKINNAINLLHLENKAITHYSISKTAGVSFNTVKKHIPNLDIIGKL